MFALSYVVGDDDEPVDEDVRFVFHILKQAPPRQKSALLWRWAAAAIRGDAVDSPGAWTCAAEDEESEIDAALDNF